MYTQAEQEEKASAISVAAAWLLASGFIIMLTGIIILILASVLQGNMSISGGIVFIGPIPVIFGAGPDAFLAILLAAVLTVIGFIVFFLLRKKSYGG